MRYILGNEMRKWSVNGFHSCLCSQNELGVPYSGGNYMMQDLYQLRLRWTWRSESCFSSNGGKKGVVRRDWWWWFGRCEGRVRFLFCGAWDEEWWVERRWILMSRVWIERPVSSPPCVFSSILHDSGSKQRVSTVLTETVLFCAQRGVQEAIVVIEQELRVYSHWNVQYPNGI